MESHTIIAKHKKPLWRSKNPVKMRDSIWSVPGYDEADFMEKGLSRPQSLLEEAFKKIPGDNWYSKLEHCASCKCCTRHQTFRPSRLVRWTDDMSERDIKLHSLKKCECDCRHMARFICRQVIVNCNDDRTMPMCPLSSPVLEDAM